MAVLPPPPEREHRAGEAEAPRALCENEAGKKGRERESGQEGEGRSVALSVCLCLTQKSASCHRKDKLPEDLILYNNIAWPRCPSKTSLTRHVLLRSFFPIEPNEALPSQELDVQPWSFLLSLLYFRRDDNAKFLSFVCRPRRKG